MWTQISGRIPASSQASRALSTASLTVVSRALRGLSKPSRWRFLAKNSLTEMSRWLAAIDCAVARRRFRALPLLPGSPAAAAWPLPSIGFSSPATGSAGPDSAGAPPKSRDCLSTTGFDAANLRLPASMERRQDLLPAVNTDRNHSRGRRRTSFRTPRRVRRPDASICTDYNAFFAALPHRNFPGSRYSRCESYDCTIKTHPSLRPQPTILYCERFIRHEPFRSALVRPDRNRVESILPTVKNDANRPVSPRFAGPPTVPILKGTIPWRSTICNGGWLPA